MKPRITQEKRRKELQRQEKQRDKAERRAQRKIKSLDPDAEPSEDDNNEGLLVDNDIEGPVVDNEQVAQP